MQTAVLIQKAIRRQSAAKTRLPSPIAQFKTFLNRGAKPSPESKAEPPPPPPPEEQEKGETLPPPDNEGGEGIDWEGGEPSGEAQGETAGEPSGEAQGETAGEPSGEPAPAGEASQDAPEPTQGASEDGAGETLPPAPETPQGVAKDAPAKSGKAKGAKKRGK